MGSANLIEAVGYFFLNSYVGAIGTILATIRCGVFYFCEKKYKKIPISVFCIFILLFTASTLICWYSYIDLLELALLIAFTTSFMLKEEWHVRSVALVGAILGIVYNLLIFNYIGVICRTVESIVLVVALIKFFKQRKKELVQYAE